MGIIGLIRAALEAVIAIPKIFDAFLKLKVEARLDVLEKAQSELKLSYDALESAEMPDEIKDAIRKRRIALNRI